MWTAKMYNIFNSIGWLGTGTGTLCCYCSPTPAYQPAHKPTSQPINPSLSHLSYETNNIVSMSTNSFMFFSHPCPVLLHVLVLIKNNYSFIKINHPKSTIHKIFPTMLTAWLTESDKNSSKFQYCFVGITIPMMWQPRWWRLRGEGGESGDGCIVIGIRDSSNEIGVVRCMEWRYGKIEIEKFILN